MLLHISNVNGECKKAPIIFNFGDSNSDTGGLVAGLGYNIDLPYGRIFFRSSSGRLSDGRLVIDFLCESVNSSYLSPYMESFGSNFSHGANFAIVGSSTLPKDVPFALDIQVLQFLHFKARSTQVTGPGSRRLMDDQGFRDALYMFDIGQNDLSDAFAKNLSYAQVIQGIPLVLAEIKSAVMTIYEQGGKNFWIHNTGPLGCLPQKLSMVDKTNRTLDQHGCLQPCNDAAKIFNEGLRALCDEFRSSLEDVNVVYVDIYTIKYDLIANASKYGLKNPLMACCGFGGPPYNYDLKVQCGHGEYTTCTEGSQYISFDGVHYAEAANKIVASLILSTNYSTPQLKFDYFCQS
ncbi:GDSL esterase/lipase [Thalictrum thalictroides]|uniref:GDSL esterase/lipase n=1 Tax=Thalictrum thalictroides TaxID=46969 RepID=A0A7J6URP6_THATH|nr:GDSL esterase/lipase [Thalictrum thalictroides]